MDSLLINLLLFLWIYQSEQQPDQLQNSHPVIGDLHIVSDDELRQLRSDAMKGAEAQQHRSPLHDLKHGANQIRLPAVKPDALTAPLKHSSTIIVTSINGYEVVVYALSSCPAAARIFDQLQPFTDVEAVASEMCGEEQCRYFDVSHFDDAGARSRPFDAARFIYEDSSADKNTAIVMRRCSAAVAVGVEQAGPLQGRYCEFR